MVNVLAKTDNENRMVESRSVFARRLFDNELRAYRCRQSLQGVRVPKYLGHFTINFHQRELAEDRVVNVLMLDVIGGKSLKKARNKLSSLECVRIREQVLEMVRFISQKEVFLPTISARHFIVVNGENSLRMIGFSTSYNPDQFQLSTYERQDYLKMDLAKAESILDETGYN